ncbi:hypothetical protein Ddc_10901 [Ditylenchus destructor]|nr:hypothetical protein Ddc_10901 [Ditylenchus destructor]
MAYSKFAQDSLLEMLNFYSRDQLEHHSVTSRQLYRLIELNFPSKPYRIFDAFHIFCDESEYSLMHKCVRWNPNIEDYNAQQFSDGKKCNQQDLSLESTHYSLSEMRLYLGRSVRIKKTFLFIREEINLKTEIIAELQTIAHLWSDQEFVIAPKSGRYFTDAMIQRIQSITNSERIFQARELTIYNPHLSFKDYSMLNSAKILKVICFSPCKSSADILHLLEKPGAKPQLVLCYGSWSTEEQFKQASLLIKLIFQSFSSASTISAFRLIIMYFKHNNKSIKEFRVENRITSEVLQLRNITENEAINYLGNYIDKINFRYILVERSQL